MTLSAASAAEQRSSSAKLEALLAKLAVRKLELDRAAAEARVAASESDASDDEPILSPAPDAVSSSEPRTNPAALRVRPARTTASVYGSKAYWDARYGAPDAVVGENLRKGETNNEWYVGWRALRPYALDYAARSHRVLLLGIGTSTLGEEMSADGFARVTAVDYSEPAIARMRREQENRLRFLARAKKRGDFSKRASLDAPTASTAAHVGRNLSNLLAARAAPVASEEASVTDAWRASNILRTNVIASAAKSGAKTIGHANSFSFRRCSNRPKKTQPSAWGATATAASACVGAGGCEAGAGAGPPASSSGVAAASGAGGAAASVGSAGSVGSVAASSMMNPLVPRAPANSGRALGLSVAYYLC